jgi:hypothetical protein
MMAPEKWCRLVTGTATRVAATQRGLRDWQPKGCALPLVVCWVVGCPRLWRREGHLEEMCPNLEHTQHRAGLQQ